MLRHFSQQAVGDRLLKRVREIVKSIDEKKARKKADEERDAAEKKKAEERAKEVQAK